MQLTRTKLKARRSQWLVWAAAGIGSTLVLAGGIAVWLGYARTNGDTTSPSSAISTPDPGEKKSIDWDKPINGTVVATDEEAAADVSFAPVVPRALGKPTKIMVDNPSGKHAGKTVAWVFQHPSHGRFFVIEGFSAWTQTSLEALATCDPSKGCEGRRALVKLQNGTIGVLITGGPTTGIIWLWHGLTFDVYGPIETFSDASAMSVVNSL